MNKLFLMYVIGFLSLFIMGCNTVMVPNLAQQSEQFSIGKTTFSEVKSKIGEPPSAALLADGKKVVSYFEDAAGSVRLQLSFDKNDILQSKLITRR